MSPRRILYDPLVYYICSMSLHGLLLTSDGELSTQRIVLEDLVRGSASTTADDAELGVQTLGGEGVLADIFPPHYDKVFSIGTAYAN